MDRAWDSSGKPCGDVLAIKKGKILANQSVRGADTREGRGASRPLLDACRKTNKAGSDRGVEPHV